MTKNLGKWGKAGEREEKMRKSHPEIREKGGETCGKSPERGKNYQKPGENEEKLGKGAKSWRKEQKSGEVTVIPGKRPKTRGKR